jgi:hypothetical protein
MSTDEKEGKELIGGETYVVKLIVNGVTVDTQQVIKN